MEIVGSFSFEDEVTKDQVWIGLRTGEMITALAVSLQSNGDLEVNLGAGEMAQLSALLAEATKTSDFKVGSIYEDCAFHPVLCTSVIEEAGGDTGLEGISLIDGSAPRSCSVAHCGPVPMTLEEALAAKEDFPAYVARRTAEVG
jgi:hypothetical protein